MLRGLTGLNLVGADLVEVAPALDTGGQTARVAAHLLFDLVYLMHEAVQRRNA
jgi:arginase family enzyme